jgi:hypothetical protein
MYVREFVVACPKSAALFATPSTSSKRQLALMLARYAPGPRYGTGYHRQHDGATWRLIVALRLTGIALSDLCGPGVNLGGPARDALEVQVENWMPPHLILVTKLLVLTVPIPEFARVELNIPTFEKAGAA